MACRLNRQCRRRHCPLTACRRGCARQRSGRLHRRVRRRLLGHQGGGRLGAAGRSGRYCRSAKKWRVQACQRGRWRLGRCGGGLSPSLGAAVSSLAIAAGDGVTARTEWGWCGVALLVSPPPRTVGGLVCGGDVGDEADDSWAPPVGWAVGAVPVAGGEGDTGEEWVGVGRRRRGVDYFHSPS